MKEICESTVHRMVKELGDLLYSEIDGPLTIVGIMTGGEYMARDLQEYLSQRGRSCQTFNIRVDKELRGLTNAKMIKNNGSTYVFVDDAVWSSRTRDIVVGYAGKVGVKHKYAVLLDPYKKADFSLFSD